jgi:sugar phosphate isomerase/epimerase
MTVLTMNRRSLLAAGLSFAAVGAMPAFAAGGRFFKRHNLQLGVECYALGTASMKMGDFDPILSKVKTAGYRSIEIGGELANLDGAKVKAKLDRWGMICPSAQSMLGPDVDLSKLADGLHTIGADTCAFWALMPVVLGHPFGFKSPAERQQLIHRTADDWRRAADFLNEKGAALKQRGIKLAYHNHNFEFAPVGDTCGQYLLMKYTEPGSVYFQLDIGWCAAAGQDPVAVFSRDRGRYWSAHIKDIKASTQSNYLFKMNNAVVGQGKLDWPKILAAAYDAGVREYFVETEDPNRNVEAITASREYLSRVVA